MRAETFTGMRACIQSMSDQERKEWHRTPPDMTPFARRPNPWREADEPLIEAALRNHANAMDMWIKPLSPSGFRVPKKEGRVRRALNKALTFLGL